MNSVLNFEHFSIDNLWHDYTLFTPLEEAINTVEKILKEWKISSASIRTGRFGIQGQYYTMVYVPQCFSRIARTQEMFLSHSNSIDMIRSLFLNPNKSFVYLYSGDERNNKIQNKQIETLFSILMPAVNTTEFDLPIFIQTSKTEHACFRGFLKDNKIQTYFSSRVEWSKLVEPQNLSSITRIFENTYQNKILNLNKEIRLQFKFNEEPIIGKSVHYSKINFYSNSYRDPIQRFMISCDLNEDLNIDVLDSKNLCLYIKKIVDVYQEANTHFFVNLIKRSIKYQSWNEIISESSMTNENSLISNLFSLDYPKEPNEITILKSAPKDSILCGLVIFLANSKSIYSFGYLWTEFLKKIRYYYAHKILIPGVGTKGPIFDHCLIYQKLQMINTCILEPDSKTITVQSEKYLLNGEKMIYPETQEISVKTEDQIQESELLLLKNEGQEIRAMLQSQQLKSDMSTFKAVNPNAVFYDFINWYSPNDVNQTTKELSKRMSTSDNIWLSMWNSVSPDEPISTFNPVEQAELAIDFLESLTPPELIGDLIPVLLNSVYFSISYQIDPRIIASNKGFIDIKNALNDFHNKIEMSSNTVPLDDYIQISNDSFSIIENAALQIHCGNSLLQKFPDCYYTINCLLENGICYISNEKQRNSLKKFIKEIGLKLDLNSPYLKSKQYLISGETEEKGVKLKHCLMTQYKKDKVIISSVHQELL